MTENTAERATVVLELAEHLENDLPPCPAGRAVLLGWLEKTIDAPRAQPGAERSRCHLTDRKCIYPMGCR